jgi:MarR family transcriptional regulator, transcriptional regulator for hemolysin
MKHTLDRDPVVLLSDVARMVRTLADARARDHGMTRAQWMILVRLDRQPGMSQNELASLIEVEPITVGRLIDRLERRGMVERCPDPQDRRIWRLHLTPAAQPMLKKIMKARAELNDILIAGLPKQDLQAVVDCLLQMKTNLAGTRAGAKVA